MMRPIFCGNFEFDARPSDLERLFKRYGKVDRVDMKSGFAFIYMEDERDAEYAIRALDRTEFGRKGRRLRVEWTKHERGGGGGGGAGAGGGRKPISSKRSANLPSKTLFVINFPFDTKTRDLERHFDPYGKILNVRIRRNFAFVQYESQEDATKALDATNMSKLLGREISVEYASRDDDERRNGGINSERRGRDRSPDRRRRSPSPYKRQRGSPDYGAGSSPAAYRRDRGSPVYGNGSSRSPRRVDRGSPEYNRTRSISPRRDVRASPEYRGRGRSRSRSPRGGDRSPRGGERNGNGHGRRPSLSPDEREEGAILDDDQDYRSPVRKPSSRDSMSPVRKPSSRDSMSPVRKPNSRDSMSPVRKPSSRDSMSPVRRPSSRDHSMSPVRKPSCRDSLSPVRRPSSRDMTGVEDGSPMDDRYRSRSPPARERSRS